MADVRELAELIARYAPEDGAHATPLARVFLHRASQLNDPLHAVYEPAVCLIAQGGKRAMVGDNLYSYSAAQYLVISVDVPVVSQLVEASPEKPFLSLRIDLDPASLGALMLESDVARAERDSAGPALAVSSIDDDLLDAAIRLMRLMANPRDIPILAPLAEREIMYRLLRGEQASTMSQIAYAESKLQQVNRAIGWIKRNFREPFSIDAVASEARMSASALHHHFKVVTAMSPLQYQKQLRLQEARRLILTQAADAATAGHSVGYESPSQFSREYKRLFGAPPVRDVSNPRLAGTSFATAWASEAGRIMGALAALRAVGYHASKRVLGGS